MTVQYKIKLSSVPYHKLIAISINGLVLKNCLDCANIAVSTNYHFIDQALSSYSIQCLIQGIE